MKSSLPRVLVTSPDDGWRSNVCSVLGMLPLQVTPAVNWEETALRLKSGIAAIVLGGGYPTRGDAVRASRRIHSATANYVYQIVVGKPYTQPDRQELLAVGADEIWEEWPDQEELLSLIYRAELVLDRLHRQARYSAPCWPTKSLAGRSRLRTPS